MKSLPILAEGHLLNSSMLEKVFWSLEWDLSHSPMSKKSGPEDNSSSSKHDFYFFVAFLWVSFAFMNPDSKSGSCFLLFPLPPHGRPWSLVGARRLAQLNGEGRQGTYDLYCDGSCHAAPHRRRSACQLKLWDMAFLLIQPYVMTQAHHSALCLQRGVIHMHESQYYMRHEEKDFPMLSQPLQ